MKKRLQLLVKDKKSNNIIIYGSADKEQSTVESVTDIKKCFLDELNIMLENVDKVNPA